MFYQIITKYKCVFANDMVKESELIYNLNHNHLDEKTPFFNERFT